MRPGCGNMGRFYLPIQHVLDAYRRRLLRFAPTPSMSCSFPFRKCRKIGVTLFGRGHLPRTGYGAVGSWFVSVATVVVMGLGAVAR